MSVWLHAETIRLLNLKLLPAWFWTDLYGYIGKKEVERVICPVIVLTFGLGIIELSVALDLKLVR